MLKDNRKLITRADGSRVLFDEDLFNIRCGQVERVSHLLDKYHAILREHDDTKAYSDDIEYVDAVARQGYRYIKDHRRSLLEQQLKGVQLGTLTRQRLIESTLAELDEGLNDTLWAIDYDIQCVLKELGVTLAEWNFSKNKKGAIVATPKPDLISRIRQRMETQVSSETLRDCETLRDIIRGLWNFSRKGARGLVDTSIVGPGLQPLPVASALSILMSPDKGVGHEELITDEELIKNFGL